MEQTYKDFKISYNEGFDRWEGKEKAIDSDVTFKSIKGLTSLKKWKRKTLFRPKNIL